MGELGIEEHMIFDLDRNFEFKQNMFHDFHSIGWPDPWKNNDNLELNKKTITEKIKLI